MAYRNPKNIIKDLTPKWSKTLASEIANICVKKDLDPWIDFIHQDHLPTAVYEAWSAEEPREYITSEMQKKIVVADDLLSDNDLVAANAAVQLMAPHYILSNDNGLTLYHVVDAANLIVSPVYPHKVIEQVSQTIKGDLWRRGIAASNRLTGRIVDFFQHNAELHSKPVLWAQPGEDVACLGRALVRPDPSVPFDHMRTFLDRLNDADAFGAWFWGVYSGRYQGRQMLYISDTVGESGKSSFLRECERLFNLVQDADGNLVEVPKARITASLNWNILRDSTHASSHFDGKRFVWIGDNKNPNILMSQAVKELSGDDMAMLNPKHLPAYSTYLEAHLVVLSNVEPNITSERHNQTRTLWLKLMPLNIPDGEVRADFSDNYRAEMPGFLAWAERCYADRCTGDTKIRVNEAVQAATALKVRECEDTFALVFDEHFVLDAEGQVTAQELNEVMFQKLKLHRHDAAHLKSWLDRSYDIVKTPLPKGGWCYKGMRLKNRRERHGLDANTGPTIVGEGFTLHQRQSVWAADGHADDA